jgi:nitroreductase
MKKLMFLFLLLPFTVFGQQDTIYLPAVDTTGGMPLMQALSQRHTYRSFKADVLPQNILSGLLWAAVGVNRPESGRRTAPTAMNKQEIDVYVATADGWYLYIAEKHCLIQLGKEDIRSKLGKQGFLNEAPVVLAFVSDHGKFGVVLDKESKEFYSATDVGFISQNVYLFCASEKLATVVIGWLDRDDAGEALKLKPDMHVVLTQCVGYPK